MKDKKRIQKEKHKLEVTSQKSVLSRQGNCPANLVETIDDDLLANESLRVTKKHSRNELANGILDKDTPATLKLPLGFDTTTIVEIPN
jgi:hypothetical protein